MTISMEQLITDCMVALGDGMGTMWSRINVITPWVKEAINSFPILRPNYYDFTVVGGNLTQVDMPADFRQIISVEYPVSQTPPVFLVRKNRFDPAFYKQAGYYDVDHNYTDGAGWILYTSGSIRLGTHVYIQYLATHNSDLADSEAAIVTVPDEYENILITGVMCRAYRQRLSYIMQDPTAHMTVITQMTEMVQHVEELFRNLVADAQKQLTNSIVSPRQSSDKYDRVY